MMQKSLLPWLLLFLTTACTTTEPESDAYGNFEAVETTVSAQATGSLLRFVVDEGQTLTAGQTVGQIDADQLTLRRAQLLASKRAIAT